MAGLSDVHASTQDTTNGTLVTTINNEAGTTLGAIQAVAPVGSKTTFTAGSRASITAADTAVPTTGLIAAQNALSVVAYATCSAASVSLTGIILLFDGSSNLLSYSEQITFSSSATITNGSPAVYYCERQILDCGNAVQVFFFVLSVTGGTWTVNLQPV